MRLAGLIALALCLTLAGCVSLTPRAEASLVEVRTLIDIAAKSYGIRPIVAGGDPHPGWSARRRPRSGRSTTTC